MDIGANCDWERRDVLAMRVPMEHQPLLSGFKASQIEVAVSPDPDLAPMCLGMVGDRGHMLVPAFGVQFSHPVDRPPELLVHLCIPGG